ncbi:PH domain-containing protein [Bacillota bacterium Lsc_1132]
MIRAPQKRISERALKVWGISGLITIVIGWLFIAGIFFFVHFFHLPIWIDAIAVGIGLLLSYFLVFLFPKLKWRRWRYEVHEVEIELQHGLFILTRTLVPMVRVQHVDTIQGPILRKYGLASVVVHTAATAHQIPALEENEAEELRVYISNLAKAADEDV